MVITVSVPMVPAPNRGYVGRQFPTPTGSPTKIPVPNKSN